MKKTLKRSLSLLLAITIIMGSAYVGLSEVDFSGLFAVRVKAASESDLTFTLNDDGESYSVTDCDTSASGSLTIPSTYNYLPVTSIHRAFYGCTSLTSITIPDSVTSIGYDAIARCTSLTSITIPDSVLSIGSSAFYGCTSLTTITIPDSVITIGDNAFKSCEKLATVTLSNSITSIGSSAFYGCKSLTSITIPDGVTSVGRYAFYNTSYYNNSSNWENGVLYIGNHLIEAKTSINGAYEIKNGTRTIAGYAFYGCTSLTSVTIPDSVTSVGRYAFYNCVSLTSITIPDGVTSIGEYTFYSCDNLTSITIPDNVTSIGDDAFCNCTSLTSITIPDSVTSIGNSALYGCTSLEYVYFLGDKDSWYKIEIKSGNSCLTDAKIYIDEVPEGYIGIYTVDDLYNVRNDLTAKYILMNDIDLTEATAKGGKYDFMGNGWSPIGNDGLYESYEFSGLFDGEGYKIIGLRIDMQNVPTGAGEMYLGLFGKVTGTIKNVCISGSINSNVSNVMCLGMLAAQVTSGKIINCYAYGKLTISNSANSDIASIVGYLKNGTIDNCHAYCDITISSSGNSVVIVGRGIGGVVGASSGTSLITLSSNHNNIKTEGCVGGVVGKLLTGGTVSKCYNSGDLSGSSVGGIVGSWGFYNVKNTGSISDCYNSGTLTGKYCSGIVTQFGQDTSSYNMDSSITDCYNVGKLLGSSSKNSIVEYDTSYGLNITTCYHLESYVVPEQTGVTILNDSEMRIQDSYVGFDFKDTWMIDESCEYPYPQLINNRQSSDKRVESIEIKTLPKTTYCRGDKLDVSGGVLTVYYVDGESYDIPIPASSVSGFNSIFTGTKTLTITYKGVTTTYKVTVYQKVVSVNVESLPSKTKYFVGENIDVTGLVVSATFEDGSTIYVDNYKLNYSTDAGTQIVTVTYGSCSTSFEVIYVEKTLKSITVTKLPNKTLYIVGDKFDRTGMVVTATYDDGSTENVTDYTVSNIPTTEGVKNLIVSYGGKRVLVQITVVAKEIVSIDVKEPIKLEYLEGEDFDPTGMEIVATYNNGSKEIVTDYTVEGFGDFVGPGIVTIVVNDEYTYDLILIVHVPADSWVIITEPSCDDEGLKVISCLECGNIAREEIIPALGHDYDIAPGKKATCTESGLTEGRSCKTCGEVISEQEVISALGHDYSTDFTVDTTATCKNYGSKSRHCSRCDNKTDITVIPATNHDYSEWIVTKAVTCTTNGEKTKSCSICKEVVTETIYTEGHNFSDWYSESNATCDNGGMKARVCAVCDEKETAPIDALGHVYSVVWTTDKTPTCTVAGSKSHHCNRCDAKTDVTEIAPLGHNFGEWTVLENATCTSSGQKYRMCSVCYSEDIEEIPLLGHSNSEWIIDSKADCENDGVRHTNCTVCGTVVNETIKAYGHDYQSVFTVDKEATCTESGSKSHHCSRCESKTDVTVIQPLGHHISTMWTIDKDPTCESEGLKSHHCLRCDCVEDVTTIPVANHIYGKWYVVTPATMDTAGVRAHKCYNCEMTEEAELPKLLKYTATFVADGDVVATVDFPEDATEIEIPEVPHKDKFNGEWENFDIRNKNFTVNAVYTPIPANEVEGIKTGNTADYYASTGEVEVNLNVSAPSRTIVTTTTKTVPLDIVFVLDQSGSMAEYGRKDALKSAVRKFSDAILADAKKYSVDHRIAVVGFASGNNYGLDYANTELLTSSEVRYDKIKNSDYADSLVSVNNNGALNNVITKAINAIDAEGATRADIGLEMATNIFANNPVTDNRQRVVVFLTDGVPTSYSNFEYNVANVAIQNAYQLKTTYDATVYSVGVFDRGTSADSKVNNFMNYVSSNYSEDVVMSKYSKETTENIGGYYLDVSDVSKLSDVFTSIVEETTTHTGRFTKATLKYTLTNNFSLTINQENAVRKNAVEKLGVTNEQISITRNDNGTTTIVISDVEPWASGTNYVIDFTFRATANGNTLKSGTYQVGTFESGVILENGEGYEAVFAPQSVDIGGTSGIAVFNINNLPYAINRLSSTTKVVAPATDFGADYNFIGWNVPNNLTLNNEVRVFEAELLKNEYKLSWNIDGEITEVKYAVGDFITVPHIGNNSIGGAFVGWDMDIPETMPSENLTITAIYDAHYHKYDVTKAFESCTEGGTLTYTCECGHTYTEEIAPCEHNWEVITASNNQNAIENAGSRCSVCGIKDSKALRLEGKSTYQMADASYNTATVELDYIDENGDKHQPDGNVEISVQLDEVFTNEIPADATATVYRVYDDGSRTILNSEQKGMQMTFTTDHFSTYEFEFTTGTQKYLFAQPKSRIDYANKVIFSDMRLARDFKDFVSYLAPATVDENADALGFMGTGTSITMHKDGVDTEYTVVINGDTNGDSVVDALDAAQVALVSNGQKTIDGAYKMAADNNQDDEISIEDYQAIVNQVVA